MRNPHPQLTVLAAGSAAAVAIALAAAAVPAPAHASGLVISEWLANVAGDDNSSEYVELVATRDINFAVTPFSVVFTNHDNGNATGAGWRAGRSGAGSPATRLTYGFQISSGAVRAGDVVYVGGRDLGTELTGTPVILRGKRTDVENGDGNLGLADDSGLVGVLGSDSGSANGIGVFDIPLAGLSSTTVPTDAIFFGNAAGNALSIVQTNREVYQLPDNDLYNGGEFGTDSFRAPAAGQANRRVRATGGVFDATIGQWTANRQFTTGDLATLAGVTELTIVSAAVPEPGALALTGAGLLPVAGVACARRRRLRTNRS